MNNTMDSWLKPPLSLKLSNQGVHVWRIFIGIDINTSIIKTILPILSADEQ